MNEYAGLSASSESLGLSTGRQQGQRSTTVWLCCQSQVCTFSPSQLIQQMVRVCVCVKARDVGLYRMHGCIHEHVLSSVHLRATIATWLKYCFSMHIPNAHIYVTFQPLISPLHALLTDVAFVGFRWVHCEVTLYRMRSCLTPDDIQMRESKSCGVSGQPWLSWFTFCFELFRL